MKAIGLVCSVLLVLSSTPAVGQAAPVAPAIKADRTLKPEYLVKGLCAAVHSISFDAKGDMWVGCLGDTKDDLNKRAMKKIYRITFEGKAVAVAEVDCTYITAVRMGKDGELYVATEGPTQILSISKDGKQRQISSDGTYRLRLGEDGGIYYASKDKTWRIAPDGVVAPALDSAGLWDVRGKAIYQTKYSGTAVTRRKVGADKSLGPEETIAELPFTKGLALDGEGSLWAYGYDNGDYVVRFKDGKIVERIRLEPVATVSQKSPQHFLNTMIVGEGKFGNSTFYFATWAGDIVRVRL